MPHLRNLALLLLVLPGMTGAARSQEPAAETVVIDASAPAHPFPHFWEQTFGSGRAVLALRESYRQDLREVRKVTEFRYVRFHAIFHDENGVYDEDEQGNPVYNFSYVDQIYDGLLENGVRPFVEISFMPRKLAAKEAIHPFWYKQNVSPPKDYAKWDDLVRHFAQHLVDRYGIEEVSQWYFEVWNEPNIDFWAGEPKQSTYFELYDHTARALKAVNPRLRVGGPATSSAHWVDDFLAHVARERAPVDFVSSHGYADDTVEDLFGTHEDIPMDQRVCRAIGKVHKQIAASAYPKLPLMWTEWNVPSFGDLKARDTIYVGAALADDIAQCDGLVDMMSYWTFDDVFEENGPVLEPFYGGFGLIAAGGIKKPAYNGFALLHKLGHERIANPAPGVLVTRRRDRSLAVAVWNLVDPDHVGAARIVQLEFRGVRPNANVRLTRVDSEHGNTLAAYEKMGKPRYPTRRQIGELNRAAVVVPQTEKLRHGKLELQLSPNALVLVEVGR
jgi:xylan 1,4-beta-xylosidase